MKTMIWVYVKSLGYTDKPPSFTALDDSIAHVIGEIPAKISKSSSKFDLSNDPIIKIIFKKFIAALDLSCQIKI